MEILGRFERSEFSGETRSRAKELALSSAIAGAYGLGTIAIGPIGYGPVQARLTDALIPMSYNRKIGKAAIYGTALGCVVANAISPYGLVDILVGTVANAAASYSSYLCQRWSGIKGKIAATVLPSIIIGVAIAGEFAVIYGVRLEFGFPSITAGELISCVGLGIPILKALERLVGKNDRSEGQKHNTSTTRT